jgi:hypothetical protein
MARSWDCRGATTVAGRGLNGLTTSGIALAEAVVRTGRATIDVRIDATAAATRESIRPGSPEGLRMISDGTG